MKAKSQKVVATKIFFAHLKEMIPDSLVRYLNSFTFELSAILDNANVPLAACVFLLTKQAFKWYLIYDQGCFIRYKARGAAERFMF